ncbi:pilus assembly protein PilF [Arsukibacterium sp. MJ3]|uniref:type IV pilus biogenesis/stability protein PilW n=1 Tax=Arsukibacterium sp. MJ3 TaxID=1632859 RepID=UPI000626F866|nr:type IV pilus biogenesis/stability protein PilW [Arsukibacterium sp. MJ3]KKO49757.1 pilus assembly protein PilF [Arsukibacterium sp. MJ3]
MQKILVGLTLCAVVTLTACVSESSYVGSDRKVGQRNLDNSEAARTRISLGLNYLRRGDTTQAKFNLERARAFAPDMPEVYNALAFYFQAVGEHAQVEEAYKQALSKDSKNADAYNNYGAFLCQVGKYDEAETLLLKAISLPGYIRVAESYENLALCELDQQGFTSAKTFLESSVSHNGTRISSLINLAAVSYAMGDNVAAKTALQRIQRLGRVSARSTLLNYLVAEKQGDMSTMKHAEQLLLSLYIDTPEARLILQQRLLESEFEQLREQYKLSLMANIVVPTDSSTVIAPTAPTDNPRLRVVRRKSTEAASNVGSAMTSATTKTAAAKKATTTANSVSRQAIAGSLALSVPPAFESSPEAGAENAAAAQELAALQQAEQEADRVAALALAAEQHAVKQAEIRLEAVRLAAERVVAVQREAKQQADKLAAEQAAAASQLVLVATPLETLPAETVLTELPSTSDTVVAEQAVPAAVAEISTPEPAALPAFHVVQEGESLYAISVQHNIRLARLMQWNQLTPESVIKTDQRIWLGEVSESLLQQAQPAVRLVKSSAAVLSTEPYHQVTAGETMFGISFQYNIRLERFMAWNSLTEQSKLRVGQQVLIVDPASVQP